jgi:hypothetical protein
MNTPAGCSDDAYVAALRSYRSADPIPLRLLVQAVEGRARRMRAEALREMTEHVLRWIRHTLAAIAPPPQPLTRPGRRVERQLTPS